MVLKNLVGNAIKFTEQGSVIVDVRAQHKGIALCVTDTGIGIPSEAHALIFEPFRQVDSSDSRRYGGSGLGLHIVQRLVALLHGTVRIESVEGQGSVFLVWVPLHQPREPGS